MMNAIRLYYYNSEAFKALGEEQGLVLAYSYSYKIAPYGAADIEASSERGVEG